ncbi:MAG: Flagellar basal-body rod protein [Microvirga sp.]|jgi:flagellar basal-body rod protein FlgG|nr:Flagellar basal-body rod protein [Microvirga sp.]
MIDALQIASSGLSANQVWLNTISNNVANMQTPGFKRGQVTFQNMVRPVSSAASADVSVASGAGVQLGEPTHLFTPGAMRETNRSLDLAIQGDGFFEITLATGETAYTRLGSFHVNAEGQLALPNGELLTSDIRIPPDAEGVRIESNGAVRVKLAQSSDYVDAGSIRIAKFAQPVFLEQIGGGLYAQTRQSGAASLIEPGQEAAGTLLTGHLELSNVDIVSEMTDLVMAQRAYQLNARLLQASDQILETINNLRR